MARTGGRGGPTMKDVAREAGVSQAAVSLVLNDAAGSRVSPETRQRVLDAVDRLGYRVNSAAKSLREGQSRLIGFVGDTVASEPFAGDLVEGAQDQAWVDGHLMLIINTGGDPLIEERAIDSLLSRQVDGIVYASMYNRRLKIPPLLREVPTVVVNGTAEDGSLPAVAPDEYTGGLEATRHLVEHGHERVAFINIAPPESMLPAVVERERGYVDALTEAGIRVDRMLVKYGDGDAVGGHPLAPQQLSRHPPPRARVDRSLVKYGDGDAVAGHRLATQLLSRKRRPSAIFCGNDRTAWGAYLAAGELGLKVGTDVSVVGFDNMPVIAPHLRPGLTSMELPFAEMGRRGVARLLSGDTDPTTELLHCPLVTRGSVSRSGPAS